MESRTFTLPRPVGIEGPNAATAENMRFYQGLVKWGIIVIVGLIIFAFITYTILLKRSKLDNRPRWMMGGLRDDTGSHNAKDVFGMGFGLDQTRLGTATTDGMYNIQLGQSTMPLGGKLQGEYGGQLGF